MLKYKHPEYKCEVRAEWVALSVYVTVIMSYPVVHPSVLMIHLPNNLTDLGDF
jgi:hypothetical protein